VAAGNLQKNASEEFCGPGAADEATFG